MKKLEPADIMFSDTECGWKAISPFTLCNILNDIYSKIKQEEQKEEQESTRDKLSQLQNKPKWKYVENDGFPELDRNCLLELDGKVMMWKSFEIGQRTTCGECDKLHWRYWNREKIDNSVIRWVYLDDILKGIDE